MTDSTTPTHQPKKPTPAAELRLDELDAAALVERIKAEDPDALKRLSKIRAAKAVESTLRALRKELDEVPERRLRFKEMGTFVVRQVERQKDGKVVQQIRLNPGGLEK